MPIFAATAACLISTSGGHHERLVAESVDPDWAASDSHVEDRTRGGLVGIASRRRHFGERGDHPGQRRMTAGQSRGILSPPKWRAAMVGCPPDGWRARVVPAKAKSVETRALLFWSWHQGRPLRRRRF